jgi:cysteine desulfuration protein SufE
MLSGRGRKRRARRPRYQEQSHRPNGNRVAGILFKAWLWIAPRLVADTSLEPVTIAEKQRQLTAALGALQTAQDRLGFVVGRGRKAPPLEPERKTDAFRVEGCLAKVWFVPAFAGGRCQFRADSDSAIVKGIAVLLCDFYSGQTPEEIVQTSPAFLEELGLTQHLTPNRRNSLGKIWHSMQTFARGHLAP